MFAAFPVQPVVRVLTEPSGNDTAALVELMRCVAASYLACQKSVSMPFSTSTTVRCPSPEGSGLVPSGMRTVIDPPCFERGIEYSGSPALASAVATAQSLIARFGRSIA